MQNYHIGSVCLPFSDVGRSWPPSFKNLGPDLWRMTSIMMKLWKCTTCNYAP